MTRLATEESGTASIVLAGGRSSRLGRDKLREVIGEKSVIQRVLEAVAPVSSEIIVVTADRELALPSYPAARLVHDIHPGKGSLGGIYSGIVMSTRYHSLVVAGDMPFLNTALLRHMVAASGSFDVVLPKVDDYVEPLHAVYSKDCLPAIEDLLRQDNLRILDFFDRVRVRYLEEEEIDLFDPKHLSFFNVNTEADLVTARELAEREGM
ncbi:MAG: molybdenum cofactor guanylyltransferase [Chloroflexi bacterium]|nr:molybdenum cofactor guanylyltransferase [Chloroflexota bacterium]